MDKVSTRHFADSANGALSYGVQGRSVWRAERLTNAFRRAVDLELVELFEVSGSIGVDMSDDAVVTLLGLYFSDNRLEDAEKLALQGHQMNPDVAAVVIDKDIEPRMSASPGGDFEGATVIRVNQVPSTWGALSRSGVVIHWMSA